ncbi:MAG TPA: MarR family transcriptional regulator [Actinomycetota bacterium]|jgi:DNA-binding MarR family transcriptional regulator
MEEDVIDRHCKLAIHELPSIDPQVEGVVSRIAKLDRYLDRSMAETLSAYDLTDGEYRVLLQLRLGADRERSPGDLSRSLLVSTGAMTNRLDRMEEAGLVVRKPDPRDRRGILVALTDTGTKLIEEAVGEQAAKEIELLTPLTLAEKKSLNGLLRKLMLSFEAKMGPPPKRTPADAEAS